MTQKVSDIISADDFYTMFSNSLITAAAKYVGVEEGQDLVQELAIDCFSPGSKIIYDSSRKKSLGNFLRMLTECRAIDKYRWKKRRGKVVVEDTEDYGQFAADLRNIPSDIMLDAEREDILDRVWKRFRKELKNDNLVDCMKMYLAMRGKKCKNEMDAIARKLGVSVNSAYVTLHRARKKFDKIARIVMEEEGDERMAA